MRTIVASAAATLALAMGLVTVSDQTANAAFDESIAAGSSLCAGMRLSELPPAALADRAPVGKAARRASSRYCVARPGQGQPRD